jgi:hypothetical protein
MRLALALLLITAACSSDSRPSISLSEDEAGRILVDRNWIDVWPEDKDDRLHVYRFVPSMGGGVFQDRTVFHGEFELFTFEIEGDTLELVLPHTGDTVRTGFRIDRVSGPAPFDLRLTLDKDPRGPRVYFGRTAETAATTLDLDLARAVE